MENEEDEETKSFVNHDNLDSPDTTKSFWDQLKDCFSLLKDYYTSKDVRILDRRLGYVYYGTLTVIIVYLVVVVFMINKAYLDTETVEGLVYSSLLGQGYSSGINPYIWDVPEENPWGHDTSAVFVPSKVIVTRRQYQGLCVDPYLYCETNADCTNFDLPNVISGNQCVDTSEGTKGCLAWRWCPPENSKTSTIYFIENASRQVIWTRINVEFKRLASTSKDTFELDYVEKYPGPNSNAWETNDITLMAGSNFSDIAEKGGIFRAKIVLQCIRNPKEKCDTHLEVDRLDSKDSGGYSMTYADYYWIGDKQYRDLYHYKGVKVIFEAIGIYVTSSLFNIVLQLASALGLIIASNAITDAVMLNILKEKSHFKKLKVKVGKE